MSIESAPQIGGQRIAETENAASLVRQILENKGIDTQSKAMAVLAHWYTLALSNALGKMGIVRCPRKCAGFYLQMINETGDWRVADARLMHVCSRRFEPSSDADLQAAVVKMHQEHPELDEPEVKNLVQLVLALRQVRYNLKGNKQV